MHTTCRTATDYRFRCLAHTEMGQPNFMTPLFIAMHNREATSAQKMYSDKE